MTLTRSFLILASLLVTPPTHAALYELAPGGTAHWRLDLRVSDGLSSEIVFFRDLFFDEYAEDAPFLRAVELGVLSPFLQLEGFEARASDLTFSTVVGLNQIPVTLRVSTVLISAGFPFETQPSIVVGGPTALIVSDPVRNEITGSLTVGNSALPFQFAQLSCAPGTGGSCGSNVTVPSVDSVILSGNFPQLTELFTFEGLQFNFT